MLHFFKRYCVEKYFNHHVYSYHEYVKFIFTSSIFGVQIQHQAITIICFGKKFVIIVVELLFLHKIYFMWAYGGIRGLKLLCILFLNVSIKSFQARVQIKSI